MTDSTITVYLDSSALGIMTNRQTNEIPYAVAPPLGIITDITARYRFSATMAMFVHLETRKQNGQPYPPETLYHIFCGIMRQVRLTRPGLDFFHDKAFAECRTVLDSKMKRLKREGVVVKGRKAEPLTEEEQILWDKGILGDHSKGINFV